MIDQPAMKPKIKKSCMVDNQPDISTLLSVHHVGGRDGSQAFPILPHFEKEVVSVMYDADPDCIVQIRERNERLPSKTLVLPYCLGGTTGHAAFDVNYDPYSSYFPET